MRHQKPPECLNSVAYWYYSHIQRHSGYVVTVFRAAMDQEVSDERPGTPILLLQPGFGMTRVFDADGVERGVIRSKIILRGLRFEMRRNGPAVWVINRSLVCSQAAHVTDSRWPALDVRYAFFGWQHLTGIIDSDDGLIGLVGPTKQHWGFAIEPGRDTFDLLSAIAFMHWKWWRW